jgi:hypothetical protein
MDFRYWKRRKKRDWQGAGANALTAKLPTNFSRAVCGGSREVALPHHRNEVPQVPQVHNSQCLPDIDSHNRYIRPTRWQSSHRTTLASSTEANHEHRRRPEHRRGLRDKTFSKVAAEMALSVLAYNLTRVMNIVGIDPLIAAICRHRERCFAGRAVLCCQHRISMPCRNGLVWC